jgi:hypothetical protein
MDQPTRHFTTPGEPPSDHPTRRLDQLPDDLFARPCLRCATPMFDAAITAKDWAHLINRYYDLYVRKRPPGSVGQSSFAETECSVWVCPACGYTELVATNPTALLES